MSTVPKSKRKQSKFETEHNFKKLRREITELVFNNFGYSEKKYEQSIEHLCGKIKDPEQRAKAEAAYRAKKEAFHQIYIPDERKYVLNLIRDIGAEFTYGNSIFPNKNITGEQELIERILHIDKAIAECYVLKNEIMSIIETLPVDINKYDHYAELIDKQIVLYKGVKKANRKQFSYVNSSSEAKEVRERVRLAAPHIVDGDHEEPGNDPSQSSTTRGPLDHIPSYQDLEKHRKKSSKKSSTESSTQKPDVPSVSVERVQPTVPSSPSSVPTWKQAQRARQAQNQQNTSFAKIPVDPNLRNVDPNNLPKGVIMEPLPGQAPAYSTSLSKDTNK